MAEKGSEPKSGENVNIDSFYKKCKLYCYSTTCNTSENLTSVQLLIVI
jgi:hypothetical protein